MTCRVILFGAPAWRFFFQGQISFDVTDGVGSRWADKDISLIPSSLDEYLQIIV